jgi:parallel beta-helix repeat protein
LLQLAIENQNGNYPAGPIECLEINDYHITDIQIPLVFHDLYNDAVETLDYDQIINFIDEVNDFLPPEEVIGYDGNIYTVNISFYLANTYSCTPGYERIYEENPAIYAEDESSIYAEDERIKANNTWPNQFYCNVYLEESITWFDTLLFDAYSNIPSDHSIILEEGIVIAKNALDKSTFLHEFGHYADLYHIWNKKAGNEDCEEHDGCKNGDYIDDTPEVQSYWLTDIPIQYDPELDFYYKTCEEWENGFCEEYDFIPYLNIHLPNPLCFPPDACLQSPTIEWWQYPVDNFMSYNFNCMYRYTDMQYARMVHYLNDDKYDMISGNIPEINIDLSSNTDHTMFDLQNALGLNSLNELCNTNISYTITLGGNLFIDQGPEYPVCFGSNTRFNMLEGAKIYLLNHSSLSLENTHIYCCDGFWEHIYVGDGSSLQISNDSKIENGLQAIRAEKNAQIDLSDCSFNNNRISLYLGEEGTGSYTELTTSNCIFSSDENYSYLLFDIMYSRPYAGIVVEGQNYVNVGPVDGTKNYFSRLSNGIIGEKSVVSVRNCAFSDIYTGGLSENYGNIFYHNGFGIFISEGMAPLHIKNNTFEDVRYAIGVNKGRPVIHDNIISNVEQGILMYDNDNIMIDHNYIDALERGIFLSNSKALANWAAFNIESNYVTIISDSPSAKGIELAFSDRSYIDNNYLTLRDNDAGIYISSSHANTIEYNTVDVMNQSNNQTDALFNEGSLNNLFDNNDVYDYTESLQNVGLYANTSSRNFYFCNDFHNFKHGMHFWDNCDGSKLKGNDYFENHKDLVLGKVDETGTEEGLSWIGIQGSIAELEGNGNTWPTNMSLAHNSAPDYMVAESQFLVNASVNADFMPDIFEAEGVWFENDIKYHNLTPCSGQPGSDLPPSCEMIIRKIQSLDTMNQIDDCQKLIWQYQYFEELLSMQKNGQLSSNCTQFLLAESDNELLKIAEITWLTDSIATDSLGDENLYIDLSETSSMLDSLVDTGEIYGPFWEESMLRLDILLNNYISLAWSEKEQDNIRIDETRDELIRVNVQDSCLQVLQEVLRIRLDLLQNDTINLSDQIRLEELALSCPSDLGLGVVKARSLYSLYKNARYPRMSECYSGYVPPRKLEKDDDNFEKMLIYPNPASDVIDIELKLAEKEQGALKILDIQGSVLYRKQVNQWNQHHIVNTSHFKPGLYFVKYVTNAGEEYTLKLSITR